MDRSMDASHPGIGDVDIPGVRRIRQSSLPQALHDLNDLFTKQFIDNGRALSQADGILVNTFDALEPVALAALRDGKVVPGFPPVYAIGLLKSSPSSSCTDGAGSEKQAAAASSSPSPIFAWLGEQPAKSVVYVAFGSRTAVSHEQLHEMAAGLEASRCRFLWVLKTTVVDREDTAEVRDVLGDQFLERVTDRGLVTKGSVEQEAVLRHAAVGVFLSHSGWNSVTEAAACGVPLLAWPRFGDQRLNAIALESGGAGVWMERWSWDGEDGVVSGREIGEKVKAAMADAAVRARAARASQEAAKAVAEGGTSYRSMQLFIGKLKAWIVPMSGGGFWTNMVMRVDDGAGLEEFSFPMTQDTQEIDEMPTEVQAVDVQPREGAPRPCSTRPYLKRTKNFDPKEDEVVVSAWLNVSKDPVHGANQSRASFWSRIRDYYEKNKKTKAYRTESSIMHRWMTILVQVNKFCGCYEAIEHRNQSGATIQDKIPPPESEARKRPMGQKKAKEALRRGGGEACVDPLDKMWAKNKAFDMEKEKKKEERYMASLELEKKRLALEEKKVNLQYPL
ncbi:unnamed protein product [Miscanthus lutarioriparius]|uniref:Glycosyltransferase n=1 Tax=Miscanthus lutarioriparius TaxID=422564 RepID=A0A811PM04_9POAL|nr:unnamed protein product [Miscanthus lutarioriparius]